mmetsp:Transcript_75995/g.111264  ORF Transcript_75995/g.111264 Transcript_75995/m.111264 type:complete len:240 (+) Transcript_75995:497-1216(+)
MSLCACIIRTGCRLITSRVRPPKVAENIPHIATMGTGRPARMPFMVPTQVKDPMPRASIQNSQLSSVDSCKYSATGFQKEKVLMHVTKTMSKYSGSPIQNDRFGTPLSCPMNMSRIVPPPTAVTVAMIIQPIKSMPLSAADRVPPIAQMTVPNQSPPRSRPPAVSPGQRGIRSSMSMPVFCPKRLKMGLGSRFIWLATAVVSNAEAKMANANTSCSDTDKPAHTLSINAAQIAPACCKK